MIPVFGYSQISDPNYDPKKMMQQNADKIEEVKSEIKSKGITEAELNAKLLDKGYNLKQLRPDQIEGMDKVQRKKYKHQIKLRRTRNLKSLRRKTIQRSLIKRRILKKQSRLIKIKKQSNLMILIFKMSFRIQLRKLLRLTLTISKRRQRCFQIH